MPTFKLYFIGFFVCAKLKTIILIWLIELYLMSVNSRAKWSKQYLQKLPNWGYHGNELFVCSVVPKLFACSQYAQLYTMVI